MNLEQFLSGLAGGALTYPAANAILEMLPETLSRRVRFFVVVALAFGLACGAYGIQVYFGFSTYSNDGLFSAMAVAFTTSQMLWGAIQANK